MRPTKLIRRRAKEAAEADEAMRQRPMTPMRLKTLYETFVDEVTGSHANNVKTLHKTFFDKVTGSHDNNVKTVHETFFGEVSDSNPV